MDIRSSFLPLVAEWMGIIAVTMILALSPRFKRRAVIFKYASREGWISLGLVLVTGIAVWLGFSQAMHITGLPYPYTVSATPLPTYTPAQLSLQLMISVLAVIPFILALLIRKQPALSVGLNPKTLGGGLQIGLGLALMTIFLRGKIYVILGGLTREQMNYLPAMLLIGLSMEFIFRGFVQPRLSSWIGPQWGWLAATALFVLWQIPQILTVVNADSMTLGLTLANTAISGLIYGWIMQKTGNVLGPGLYHAFHLWVAVL